MTTDVPPETGPEVGEIELIVGKPAANAEVYWRIGAKMSTSIDTLCTHLLLRIMACLLRPLAVNTISKNFIYTPSYALK